MPHYRVPWLQGKFKGQTVKDETDEWKKCLHEQDWQERKNFFPRTRSQKNLHICYVFVQILASIICFSTYLIAFILHGITISIISQRAAEIFSNTKIYGGFVNKTSSSKVRKVVSKFSIQTRHHTPNLGTGSSMRLERCPQFT